MYQIIYARTVNPKFFGKDEIKKILNKARVFNSSQAISGILLFRSEIFIQLLEGDKEKVKALYEKIKQDPRHSNVTDIAVIEGGTRIFTDWDMAYKEVNDDFNIKIINEMLKWNHQLTRAPKVTNQHIIKMLSHFREQIDGTVITDHQED